MTRDENNSELPGRNSLSGKQIHTACPRTPSTRFKMAGGSGKKLVIVFGGWAKDI